MRERLVRGGTVKRFDPASGVLAEYAVREMTLPERVSTTVYRMETTGAVSVWVDDPISPTEPIEVGKRWGLANDPDLPGQKMLRYEAPDEGADLPDAVYAFLKQISTLRLSRITPELDRAIFSTSHFGR